MQWWVESNLPHVCTGLTKLPGWIDGLSIAMVMQHSRMHSRTVASNALWEVTFLQITRHLASNKTDENDVKMGAYVSHAAEMSVCPVKIQKLCRL